MMVVILTTQQSETQQGETQKGDSREGESREGETGKGLRSLFSTWTLSSTSSPPWRYWRAPLYDLDYYLFRVDTFIFVSNIYN